MNQFNRIAMPKLYVFNQNMQSFVPDKYKQVCRHTLTSVYMLAT